MVSQTSGRGGAVREFFTPGRIVVLIIVAVTLIFVFQNTRETRIQLLLAEVTMPLWVALFGTLLVGIGSGYFLKRHNVKRR
jgi:uncharacterized integral membrane protein